MLGVRISACVRSLARTALVSQQATVRGGRAQLETLGLLIPGVVESLSKARFGGLHVVLLVSLDLAAQAVKLRVPEELTNGRERREC